MSEWQPIETASRDADTCVDLWIMPPTEVSKHGPFCNSYAAENSPEGRRRPDCCPARNGVAWVGPDGKYVTGRYYYDDEGDGRIDLDDDGPASFRASHWMPPSPPPSDTGRNPG